MFDTTGFWKDIIIFVGILVLVYVLLNLFVFKLFKNKDKTKDIVMNLFLFLGIMFLFYRIYNVIPKEINTFDFPEQQFFMQNIVNSVLNICVLALATTGIVLIFKTSTTTNFAQGMMATFGAFVTSSLLVRYAEVLVRYAEDSDQMPRLLRMLIEVLDSMPHLLIMLLVMLAGALTAFLIGIFIDVVIIRNSKVATPVGKQMITMGLVLVLSGIMPLLFNTIAAPIPKLSTPEQTNKLFTLFGQELSITTHAFYALIITIILLGTLFSLLRFTKWGLGVRATASNEIVASMMGVNTKVITALSWAIAGFLGGVAAVLLTPNATNVTVSLMIPTQVNGFMAAILGSFGSFLGPLIASILIPVLTGLLSFIVPLWQNAIVYVIILVLVLVKPMGLFGRKVAKKV